MCPPRGPCIALSQPASQTSRLRMHHTRMGSSHLQTVRSPTWNSAAWPVIMASSALGVPAVTAVEEGGEIKTLRSDESGAIDQTWHLKEMASCCDPVTRCVLTPLAVVVANMAVDPIRTATTTLLGLYPLVEPSDLRVPCQAGKSGCY